MLAAHARGFVPFHRAGRTVACINLVGLTTIFALQSVTGIVVERFADGSGPGDVTAYRITFALVAAVLLSAGAIYLRARDVPPSVAVAWR